MPGSAWTSRPMAGNSTGIARWWDSSRYAGPGIANTIHSRSVASARGGGDALTFFYAPAVGHYIVMENAAKGGAPMVRRMVAYQRIGRNKVGRIMTAANCGKAPPPQQRIATAPPSISPPAAVGSRPPPPPMQGRAQPAPPELASAAPRPWFKPDFNAGRSKSRPPKRSKPPRAVATVPVKEAALQPSPAVAHTAALR